MWTLSAPEDRHDLWTGHLTDPEEVVALGRLSDPTPIFIRNGGDPSS
jgi:hypothetical protein